MEFEVEVEELEVEDVKGNGKFPGAAAGPAPALSKFVCIGKFPLLVPEFEISELEL